MRVLVADDQADVREGLRFLFKVEGIEGLFAASPEETLAVLADAEGDVDIALVDLNFTRDTTSGREGLDLLARLRRLEPELPIVVMTGWSSVPVAVEAMRRGARDYVEKPWDNDALLTILRRHGEGSSASRRARAAAKEKAGASLDLPPLIAGAPSMEPVLRVLERVAPSDAHVLVTGEHGTGKDVVARWLHARSRRAKGPFVPVHVGALPTSLFESELFGHVRGAFTGATADRVGCFELAHGGTLFLDEIGTLSPEQQAKLLRVLQTGELTPVGSSRARSVDVRIVAATNAVLRDEVQAGRFREDLLYRINTVEIALPPLRDRPEDIVPLARHFLERFSARYQMPGLTLDASAADALRAHVWPGNVRELGHALERGVLMAQGSVITAADLALTPASGGGGMQAGGSSVESMTLEQAERYLIERALLRAGGNAQQAAKALGLSRSAFYRRLQTLRGGGP